MVHVFLKPFLWLIVTFMCIFKGYYLNLCNLSVFFPDYLSVTARGQVRDCSGYVPLFRISKFVAELTNLGHGCTPMSFCVLMLRVS